MKFRKKPIVIEAFKYGVDPIPDWFMDKVSKNQIVLRGDYKSPSHCVIKTLEGIMIGDLNDYIIQGIKGEIYPCKPDIFEATYDQEDLSARLHKEIDEQRRALLDRLILSQSQFLSNINLKQRLHDKILTYEKQLKDLKELKEILEKEPNILKAIMLLKSNDLSF